MLRSYIVSDLVHKIELLNNIFNYFGHVFYKLNFLNLILDIYDFSFRDSLCSLCYGTIRYLFDFKYVICWIILNNYFFCKLKMLKKLHEFWQNFISLQSYFIKTINLITKCIKKITLLVSSEHLQNVIKLFFFNHILHYQCHKHPHINIHSIHT